MNFMNTRFILAAISQGALLAASILPKYKRGHGNGAVIYTPKRKKLKGWQKNK